MAYFIHKYMLELENTKQSSDWFQNDWMWGVTRCVFFGGMLQISQSSSFVPNSLSVPFPEDGGQVFLDGHLLSVAAVAVCEDAV